MTTRLSGRDAEALVSERVRSALDVDYRDYENVSWLGRTREHGANGDGEANLVIAHRSLVVEARAGRSAASMGMYWCALRPPQPRMGLDETLSREKREPGKHEE